MQLLLYFSILLTASAANVQLQSRVDDSCETEIQDNIGDDFTTLTSGGTAGLGVEFESPFFYFINPNCNNDDTNAAKKEIIAERTGKNWQLTADTGGGAGKLQAEYIFDGENIKVGSSSGDAAAAGKSAADDLIAWHPWSPRADPTKPNTLNIANSKCNPWNIEGPSLKDDPAKLSWSPQVTVAMPLEGLYSLMKEQKADPDPGPNRNILDGFGINLALVTKDYFQTNPNDINGNSVTDDVLGFCSLVLTFAKSASKALKGDESPKLRSSFMPRTEFNTIYNQVKSKFKGDLFALFDVLACYTTAKDGSVSIDADYCSGDVKKPSSLNKFKDLTYSNPAAKPAASVNIKDWITGIGAGTGDKDLLSKFDESIDGSIGGRGNLVEKMYNNDRSVPLFEFRDLVEKTTAEFETFMGDVDKAVQDLHTTFAKSPQKKKRDIPASCYSAASGTITPPPSKTPSCELHNEDPDQGINQAFCLCDSSITLTPLPATNAQSESCAYKSIPTGTSARETVTTATEVWTSNCAACTIVGGIADAETCTSVKGCTPTAAPTPTIAAWVGNLSTIDIGNAEDGNGGKDLATEMFGKLKAMCSGSTCKGDHAEMDHVEAAIADGEEPLKPAMYLQDATYSSQAVLEKMLSVGISSWIAALNDDTLKLCKDVEYEADADETGSGCGKGPIPTKLVRRKVRADTREVLYERGGLAEEERKLAERCSDTCDHPMVCHYKARMCSAPNEITVVMAGAGDPYANRLNIGITLDKEGDGFLCEEITAALTAATVLLAPELLEADALEGVELEAICGIIKDPSSIVENLKETKASRRVVRRAPKAVPAF